MSPTYVAGSRPIVIVKKPLLQYELVYRRSTSDVSSNVEIPFFRATANL